MTSNPIAECCTVPLRHDGELAGTMMMIGETAILCLPDGFGLSNNAKLLADRFAALGYLALLPDLFEGDPFPDPRPADFNLQAWLNTGGPSGKGHLPDTVDPIIEAAIRWLKEEKKISKIGGTGYCFGGKYVVRYLRNSFIDVGFVAHPTNATSAELSAIDGPLSIAAAELDPVFTQEKRVESENILRENTKSLPWHISLYSGVAHGFAVRANRAVEKERWAMDQAHEQAVAWMKEYLK
ncbi:hypothetical protein BP6252_06638 [Coleophoma cylindrospora]|uniref:Dienelactone hydrolase domain-containing protein n=1 Tax=Coleophoma cylindrospora TaxID=1849047 RepID=A0A3D8RNG9_9HELO|nr:hypothetical protein BP6252_06638 [Coleophoma cylindrospora]